MKYKELDSKQCANYWALMGIVDIMYDEFKEGHPQLPNLMKSLHILETNLKIELFTDDSYTEEKEES